MKLSAAQIAPFLQQLADDLGPRNHSRLQALVQLLDHEAQTTVAAVLQQVLTSNASATPESQNKAFSRLRDEFNDLAQEKKLNILLQVTGAKALGDGRLVWFEGEPQLHITHATEELARVDSRLIADSQGVPLNPEPRITLTEKQGDKPLVRWFLSYAHADAKALALYNKLKTSLGNSPKYHFEPWSDQHILVGENWDNQIQTALQQAQLGVLLLSQNFLASRYITQHELPMLVAGQHPQALGKRVIPVALEPIDFEHTDLKGLQAQQIFLDEELKAFSQRSSAKQTEWISRLVAQIHKVLERHASVVNTTVTDVVPVVSASPAAKLKLHTRHMLSGSGDLTRTESHLLCDTQARLTTLDANLLDDQAAPAQAQGVDALKHLLDWAEDSSAPGLFALLAEYGMGKTITCQRLVRAVEEKRAAEPGTNWPQPLYFDLRKLTGLRKSGGEVPTLNEIVDECIRRGWAPDGKPPTAQELIDRSRDHAQLWVFDGLDEALVHLTEVDGQNFSRELLRLQARPGASWHPGTKLLISCRTHFFRSLQAQNNHFTGQQRDTTPASDYRALMLLPLSEAQVRTYLQHALPGLDADATLAMVKQVHNLSELASRPYTLKLVTEFIPQIERWRAEGRPVYGVTLYRQMVQSWMQRDSGKHHLKPEHKERLMTHLAAWMWQRGQRLIEANELEPWFLAWLEEQPDLRLRYRDVDRDKLEEDLRTATFLVREDGDGDAAGGSSFRFAHSSMQEYFLAVHLFNAIQADRRTDWALPLVSQETRRFLGQCLQEANKPALTQRLSDWCAPYQPQASEQLLRYALEAVAEGWPAPSLAGVDMRGADLHGWAFKGRSVQEPLNLSGANFSGAELRETVWCDVRLDDAQMHSAALDRCEWERVQAPRADLSRASLHGVNWRLVEAASANVTDVQSERAWAVRSQLPAAWPVAARLPGATQRWFTAGGHSSPVTTCAVSPDGTRVVSGSGDNTLRVWDTVTGRCLATWNGHKNSVNACAYSPDGTRVISASGDNTLHVWDAATGQCLTMWAGHEDPVNACAYSPDGTRVVSASDDKTLRMWDAATGRCLATWAGHKGGVSACAYSPDGTRVVSASGDNTLRLWDTATGRCLATWAGHKGGVSACAYSPDGTHVVSASGDNTLRVWDVGTGRCLATWAGYERMLNACAYSPDGMRVISASGDNTLRVWDAATGRCLATWTGHQGSVNACAYFPDGTRVVSASWDNTLHVWDVATGRCLATWAGHERMVNAFAYSPDGTRMVSASGDSTLRVWDAATGRCLATWVGHQNPVNACAYSPDSTRVVLASWDNRLCVWDVVTGQCLATWARHESWVSACTYSPDGAHVFSASLDQTLRIWEVATGRCLATWTGHEGPVNACAYSPDGTSVVSASWDNTLRVWDAATGRCLATWAGHEDPVSACAYSSDGTRVVSASWDSTLRVWDAATGRCLATWVGHQNPVSACAYSPDGTRVVSGSWDKTLRLWDAATGRCLATWAGHESSVMACVFSSGGMRVISTSADGTQRIWDATTGECLRIIQIANGGYAVWEPSTQRLIEASEGAWRWLAVQLHDEEGRLLDVRPAEEFITLPYPPPADL